MRAIFDRNLIIRSLEVNEQFVLDDDRAHHLINVARVKLLDEFLVLDGEGLKILAKIVELTKKKIVSEIISKNHIQKEINIDLAIGQTKKDAFETIVNNCAQMGVNKIFPLDSTFSQKHVNINNERVKRILESGCIQSNNLFFPKIEKMINFGELNLVGKSYDKIICFDLSEEFISSKKILFKKKEKLLIIIGPEGGLSRDELYDLKKAFLNAHFFKIPTPILRSETSTVAGIAYVLGKLN